MPFTPFHLGPGALFKAIGGKHFSFMVFGGTQVLMDLEPLMRIRAGDTILHGPSHTLGGALGIGIVATLTGKPITHVACHVVGADCRSLTWRVSAISAFVGSFSHVLFDGLMHADMQPFWPLTTDNPLLGLISVNVLHVICAVAGAAGVAAFLVKGQSPPDAS